MVTDIDTLLSTTGLQLRRRDPGEGRHIDILDADGAIRATIRQAPGGLPRWRVLPDGEWRECGTVERARLAAVKAVAARGAVAPVAEPITPERVRESHGVVRERPEGMVTAGEIALAIDVYVERVREAIRALGIQRAGQLAMQQGTRVALYPESAIEAVRKYRASLRTWVVNDSHPNIDDGQNPTRLVTVRELAEQFGYAASSVKSRLATAGCKPSAHTQNRHGGSGAALYRYEVAANVLAGRRQVADVRRVMGDL